MKVTYINRAYLFVYWYAFAFILGKCCHVKKKVIYIKRNDCTFDQHEHNLMLYGKSLVMVYL